ncbi:MAG: toluene monooxygenase system protein [Acidimicrobiaceae bacterium]|nr:toluene monooxygenase system protein [Acidimicrobiaceae bacterium]MDQ1415258.1 toluene monooxygenase system protein [Acidimicrobiaceae bacterium]
MTLGRDDWLDVARKVDWTYRYVSEEEVFPPEMSGRPWLPHDSWQGWNEAYRTTYREYVSNQRAKDDAVLGVRSALSKVHILEGLDPGWLQLVKFHNGALALAEYAGAVAELRMARFGRDSAWRMMATLGALDEIRHTQIPLLLGHDMLRFDGNFDWTHKAYHTNEWMIIAARHLFDDMFLAADAIDLAIQLNLVFETGFSNLQFMAMAAMADRASHHLFEKALASIQTDEARHSQIGHPVLRTLIENGGKDRAQFLVDKMWWRCWRLLIALTGSAMEYLVPVEARTRSFKEFMEEWVIEQFTKNLAEFGLERPWFWDLFLEELDSAHHSFQLGLYAYRTTLWFDVAMPDAEERCWLSEKYPQWDEIFGPFWKRLEEEWATNGEAGTLAYALPAICNLCQLPTLFVRPGKNTACTLMVGGRNYLFCSQPCRWIFEQQKERFTDHRSVVDRIVAGQAPGKLIDLHDWMGLQAPTETGKDLRRGLSPWRLEPVPTA